MPLPPLKLKAPARSRKKQSRFRLWLKKHHACERARRWVGDRTPRQWGDCKRPSDLLWLVGEVLGIKLAGEASATGLANGREVDPCYMGGPEVTAKDTPLAVAADCAAIRLAVPWSRLGPALNRMIKDDLDA
jgi:hypothetical protein